MKLKLIAIVASLLMITMALSAKPLSERLVSLNTNVDYDEEYNKALDEMQSLSDGEKEKLSKDLGTILTTDKIAQRRANAASALGDMCAAVRTNVDFLKKSTVDKEKIVRQATVSGLKRCGKSPVVLEALNSLKNDPDQLVKTQVEIALESFR